MGTNFRENLRAELDLQGVIVKELSTRTNIPVATLDCYLRTQSTEPSAENAVKIARALRVSVEYLVIGEDTETKRPHIAPSRNIQEIIRLLENLKPEQCRAILHMVKAFRD